MSKIRLGIIRIRLMVPKFGLQSSGAPDVWQGLQKRVSKIRPHLVHWFMIIGCSLRTSEPTVLAFYASRFTLGG